MASGSGTKAALRRGLARTARRVRHGRPVLSVIVLACGGDRAAQARLNATLSSVRDQPSPEIEIVVVTFDGGHDTALAAAGDDTRARFLRATDVAEARDLGVRRSAGSHVLIAGPGDLYPAGALADLVGVLAPSEVLLLSDGPTDPEPADLDTRPDVARSPYLGRLILPRPSALRVIARPPDPDPDGLRTALDVLARGFTPTPYAAWRDDRGPKPRLFSHRYDPLPHLGSRIAADLASLDIGVVPVRQQRALGALDTLRPFLESAEGADDPTWERLSAHAATLVAAGRDQLESLDIVPRALALLAADGRREDLVRFATLVTDRRSGQDLRTEVKGDRVVAELGVDLPEDDRVIGEHQSCLVAQARRLYVEDAILHLEVFLGIRHVDQTRPPVVGASLVDGDRSLPLLVRSGSDAAVTRWMDETEHDHDAGLLELSIPAADLTPGAWEIHLDWADGDLRRAGMVTGLAQSGSASRPPFEIRDGIFVGLKARHARVALRVTDVPVEIKEPTLNRVELAENELRLTVAPDVDQVRLVGSGLSVEARAGNPGFWSIPLTADPWGLGARPLPSGVYKIRLYRAGAKVAVLASVPLTDRLPEDRSTALHRVQVLAARDGVAVRLDAPLTDDELGIRSRWVQRAAYAAITAPVEKNLVYFQSFHGQGAGDHPRAIAEELLRRRPDLDVRWAVSDSSAPFPDGATPVLVRSRAWYDVLARAGHLVVNVELERWFRRRAGQKILQTFHGYPSKAMGLGLWEPRGLLPSHIRLQLEQSSGTWNHLLTPAPEMDQYYRRDYAYEGPILALGSPRNDELVDARAPQRREEVRQRLGIAPDQRAVLYAPTWRDNLATNYRVAQAVHHLDVEQAAAALGEGWVLLLRGHRFHAPGGARSAAIIDVTSYPEINDLILASDAAVLDYSSLRFDFALTSRPMIFMVPDLEDYTGTTRGFLWDYRETAPGPLVSTTAEVVSHLRDFDGLSDRYAGDLAAFNDRYNRLQDGHSAERVVEAFFGDLLR